MAGKGTRFDLIEEEISDEKLDFCRKEFAKLHTRIAGLDTEELLFVFPVLASVIMRELENVALRIPDARKTDLEPYFNSVFCMLQAMHVLGGQFSTDLSLSQGNELFAKCHSVLTAAHTLRESIETQIEESGGDKTEYPNKIRAISIEDIEVEGIKFPSHLIN